MAGIALFVQDLSSFSPSRARELNQKIINETGRSIEAVYALAWPNYDPPASPVPQANRQVWRAWQDEAGLRLWAWVNARPDQQEDVLAMRGLFQELRPVGWLLDIEGEWTKGAKLGTLIIGAKEAGIPVRASLAGASPSHVEYDWRTLDQQNVQIDWQAYFDSGEGCRPDYAIQQLYQPSFVIGGWEYRHLWKATGRYGWGKAGGVWDDRIRYDSYTIPKAPNGTVRVTGSVAFELFQNTKDLFQPSDLLKDVCGMVSLEARNASRSFAHAQGRGIER